MFSICENTPQSYKNESNEEQKQLAFLFSWPSADNLKSQPASAIYLQNYV